MSDAGPPEHLSDHDLLVRIDNKLDTACSNLAKHELDLNGNGKPGLKQDMVVVQAELRLIMWVGGLVTAAVVGLIVTTIWRAVASVPG